MDTNVFMLYYSCKFVTLVVDISLGVFVYPACPVAPADGTGVKLFQHLFNRGARLFYDFSLDVPHLHNQQLSIDNQQSKASPILNTSPTVTLRFAYCMTILTGAVALIDPEAAVTQSQTVSPT